MRGADGATDGTPQSRSALPLPHKATILTPHPSQVSKETSLQKNHSALLG